MSIHFWTILLELWIVFVVRNSKWWYNLRFSDGFTRCFRLSFYRLHWRKSRKTAYHFLNKASTTLTNSCLKRTYMWKAKKRNRWSTSFKQACQLRVVLPLICKMQVSHRPQFHLPRRLMPSYYPHSVKLFHNFTDYEGRFSLNKQRNFPLVSDWHKQSLRTETIAIGESQ